MPDPHLFQPAAWNPNECDECGDRLKKEEHPSPAEVRFYTVEWSALVQGSFRVLAHNLAEARQQVAAMDDQEVFGEVDNYDRISPQPLSGRLLRVRSLKVERR
jgi:hypothetical protein